MSIAHDVQFLPQRTASTCWFASLCMVLRWGLRHGKPLAPEAKGMLEIYQRRDRPGVAVGAPDRAIARIAGSLGLRRVPFQPSYSSPDTGPVRPLQPEGLDLRPALIERLLRRGPFVLPCLVRVGRGLGAHVVVVRGYRDDNSVLVLDPADLAPSPLTDVGYTAFLSRYAPHSGAVYAF